MPLQAAAADGRVWEHGGLPHPAALQSATQEVPDHPPSWLPLRHSIP